MDKIVNVYRNLCLIPTLLGAQLGKQGNILYCIWSHRNLEKSKTTKFLRNFLLNPDLSLNSEFQPVDISNELMRSHSPSEKYVAILREGTDKQYLEIWQHQNLFRTVDLKAADIHGDIYVDDSFRSFEWSPDESKLLYIAEKKILDSEPFYKRKGSKPENNKVTPGEEYIFRQSWGEQLAGRKQSVIAEYNIQEDSIQILNGLPENICPGQVKYSPCGEYVIGVAYGTTPRKLGLIYCSNRPGAVFKLKNGQYETLSNEDRAASSPIFSLDGKSIFYLERDAKGPHGAAVALIQRNLTNTVNLDVQRTVVKIVEDEIDIENKEKFFGLFGNHFNKRCWASEHRLLLTSINKNYVHSYIIDTVTEKITRLPCENTSLCVIDVHNDIILANKKNFLSPDVLLIGKLPPKGQESSIVWIELTPNKKIEGLENFKYEDLNLCQEGGDSINKFTAIYVGPSSGPDNSVPLVVYPHGGPHSAFANSYSLGLSFNMLNGYAALLVNYRGSTGAGDKSVHFLLGRVGTSDVSDCVLATKTALAKYPWLDPSKLVLCGGSHGGFLVTHLSGQHPDMFKAVVSRNPVIDIASMSVFSDIPDWCFVEAGEEYTQKGPLDDEILLKMRKASPIEHAHKVKAPTMLQVGSCDLRVPHGQSFEYYYRLKANGVEVEMFLYEDNHALSGTKVEMDAAINTVLWFNKHLKK